MSWAWGRSCRRSRRNEGEGITCHPSPNPRHTSQPAAQRTGTDHSRLRRNHVDAVRRMRARFHHRRLVRALWEVSAEPHMIAKLSGIGCSSKTPAYFVNGAHGLTQRTDACHPSPPAPTRPIGN